MTIIAFSLKPFPTKSGLEDTQKRGQSANKVSFMACHDFGQAEAIAFASPVVNLTTCSPLKHFSSRIDYRSSVIGIPRKTSHLPCKNRIQQQNLQAQGWDTTFFADTRRGKKIKERCKGRERNGKVSVEEREQCLLGRSENSLNTNKWHFFEKQNYVRCEIYSSLCLLKNVPSFLPLFSLNPSV